MSSKNFSPGESFTSILDEPGLLCDDDSQASLEEEVLRILKDNAEGEGETDKTLAVSGSGGKDFHEKSERRGLGASFSSFGSKKLETSTKVSESPSIKAPTSPFRRVANNSISNRRNRLPESTKTPILRTSSGGESHQSRLSMPSFRRSKTVDVEITRDFQSPGPPSRYPVRRSRSGSGRSSAVAKTQHDHTPVSPAGSHGSPPKYLSIFAPASPRNASLSPKRSLSPSRSFKAAGEVMYSTVMAPVVAGKMVVHGAVQAGSMATHAAVDAGNMATHAVVEAGNAVVDGSKAIIEGTSTAVGMTGKSLGKSVKKWTALKGFNTNMKSKKSKWEEGMDVIDQILNPESEAYKVLTPDQRDQLAGVKNLLIKGTNFGGLNTKDQHIPQDLLQSMKFQPELSCPIDSLHNSVKSRNTDHSASSDIMHQLNDEHDKRRRKSMIKSSQYILQEYAGVRDHSALLDDFSEPGSANDDALPRRGNVHTPQSVDGTTVSTTDCSEALTDYDVSDRSLFDLQSNSLVVDSYFIPPEFTYLSRQDQLSVYEMLKWDSLGKWDFNVFDLDKASNGSPLLFVGWAIMGSPYSQRAMAKELGLDSEAELDGGYNFMDDLKIPHEKLYHFVNVIEQDYNKENPYHNAIHGADVLQSLHVLLEKSKEENFMTSCPKLALFSILLSALCHDVAHFGTTNAFHKTLKTELSVMYNDHSVMENWHVAHAFARMLDLDLAGIHTIQACDFTFAKNCQKKHSDCNLLCNATEEQFTAVRKMVIDAVLHTDMSNHFEMVNAARGMLAMDVKDVGADNVSDDSPNDNCWRILMFMLHMADISGQAKTRELSDLWTQRCMDEFFNQGDEEAKMGLPISPNCDRKTVIVSESQIGFIKFVVEPAYAVLADYIPFVKEEVLSKIQENTMKFMGQ